jgi:dipeptidyl aminopeptidase/acylaminoacyl peptidase
MDVYTGRTKLVTKVPTKHGGQYLADKNGVVRLAVAKDEDAKKEDLRNALYLREGKTWRKLNISVNAREESLAPLYVDPKGTFAYVSIGREDQGPSALYHLDLKTNKLKKIASDPISDLVTSRYDYFDEKPYAAVFYPGKQRLVNLDNGSSEMKRMMASLNHISKDPNESVIVTSATQDRSKFIVAFRSDRRPGDYYLFDYKNSKMRYLFSSAPWINPKNMAKMQPVTITARDGLKMQAYLSLPPNAKGPIPFVINIHGGPHGVRDYFGYNPEVQHFTARGYGVLQVNYRGSGGYGSKFLKAGYQKWGQEMQNDLTDSTHWLIKKGYAHPKKICLFGHSYGGYATLMGLVREPDLYACGICSVGVADLNLMIKKGHDGSDRKETKNFFKKVLKTEDQAWLNENSAAMNADRIKAPLFLVHGRNDVRVPFYQFEAMKAAMDKAGKPYEWMVRDEGHGFYKEQNRLDFSVKTIEFLDKHTKTK